MLITYVEVITYDNIFDIPAKVNQHCTGYMP